LQTVEKENSIEMVKLVLYRSGGNPANSPHERLAPPVQTIKFQHRRAPYESPNVRHRRAVLVVIKKFGPQQLNARVNNDGQRKERTIVRRIVYSVLNDEKTHVRADLRSRQCCFSHRTLSVDEIFDECLKLVGSELRGRNAPRHFAE